MDEAKNSDGKFRSSRLPPPLLVTFLLRLTRRSPPSPPLGISRNQVLKELFQKKKDNAEANKRKVEAKVQNREAKFAVSRSLFFPSPFPSPAPFFHSSPSIRCSPHCLPFSSLLCRFSPFASLLPKIVTDREKSILPQDNPPQSTASDMFQREDLALTKRDGGVGWQSPAFDL